MRMETNWEDNQLMREAARSAQHRAAREKQIHDMVAESIIRLRAALREDFYVTDKDAAALIIAELGEFEKCGEPGCTQDATTIALHAGVLDCRCAVHCG